MTATAHQLNIFQSIPELPAPAPKKPKAIPKPKGPARGEFPQIEPPNLLQESSLWLVGQRSIAAQRGKRYVKASVKHPGKMFPDLAGAIIDTYTEPGWHIVDCMGGIGTTGVEGAERGRHVTCVELVKHWANVAYANALRTAHRGAPGTMRVIQGDARRLLELVSGSTDAALFSPPYGDNIFVQRDLRNMRAFEGRTDVPEAHDAVLFSPPYGDTNVREMPSEFGRSSPGGHFSDAPRGYDAVVTSPVYGDSRIAPVPSGVVYRPDGEGLDVGNLPRGYDAVTFSPPYGDTNLDPGLTSGLHFGRDPDDVAKKKARQGKTAPGYDAVVTSPAYGDIRQDGGNHQFGDSGAMNNYSGEARVKKGGRDRTNVGNLKYGSMDKALALIARLKAGERIPESEWPAMEYLESMALIYWNCLQVLRSGGLCILVLKDYRREKQRVDLLGDTIALMKAVGFLYHDKALALTSKAEDGRVVVKVSPFVRVNARKPEKNGGPILLPAGEEVLVFRKE